MGKHTGLMRVVRLVESAFDPPVCDWSADLRIRQKVPGASACAEDRVKILTRARGCQAGLVGRISIPLGAIRPSRVERFRLRGR
jgi:hypothetical protein